MCLKMRRPFRSQNAAVTAAFFIAPLLPSIFIPLVGPRRLPPDVMGALVVYLIALPFVFAFGGRGSHGARSLGRGLRQESRNGFERLGARMRKATQSHASESPVPGEHRTCEQPGRRRRTGAGSVDSKELGGTLSPAARVNRLK